MHWADVEAKSLASMGNSHRIATGITPSGHIHVGNMREILTGDALFRASSDLGLEVEFIYIGDTIDPLRKVYPFLDPKEYTQHINKPLYEIPCPCGEHKHYAEHFLEPFLSSIREMGVNPTVFQTHQMYANGEYAGIVAEVIGKQDAIRQILESHTGRVLPENWFPYTVKCGGCLKYSSPAITGMELPFIRYDCGCGHSGKADIRTADGKLPWRIDWPARWKHLGVTCEPFGKDHAAAGGSYETGKAIIEEVLNTPAPHPVVYEWIQLKGKGAMSSSSGVVVSGVDMLAMTPPEVFRFFIMRNKPGKHMDFDPGLGLLNLVDEYDRVEDGIFENSLTDPDAEELERAYVLSQVNGKMPDTKPAHVPYRHMVSIAQIANDWEEALKTLTRGAAGSPSAREFSKKDEARLKARLEAVRFWLNNFAPDMVKFSLQQEAPAMELDQAQLEYLLALSVRLEKVDWTASEIHTAIHDTSKEKGLATKKAFTLLYRLFVGKKQGPKLGYFLSSLEREFVLARVMAHLDL